MYLSPKIGSPLMLPSRSSMSKAWPTIPHILYWLLPFKISRCLRTAWCSFSLVVGHWQGICFHLSVVGLDVNVIIGPLPSFGACAPSVEDCTMMSGKPSTAQWKSVKVFRVSHHEMPTFTWTWTCRSDLAVSILRYLFIFFYYFRVCM